jgi:hypothetical protein
MTGHQGKSAGGPGVRASVPRSVAAAVNWGTIVTGDGATVVTQVVVVGDELSCRDRGS